MFVRKIFLTFFCLEKFLCPVKFFGKKKFKQGNRKKKLSTQAKIFEKISIQVGNGPPPPPPHHFFNGPSLMH
jgi:hypothetical protein